VRPGPTSTTDANLPHVTVEILAYQESLNGEHRTLDLFAQDDHADTRPLGRHLGYPVHGDGF
jgi:hypothetical protein